MPEIIIPCAFDHLVRALSGQPVRPTHFGQPSVVRYVFEGPQAALESDE